MATIKTYPMQDSRVSRIGSERNLIDTSTLYQNRGDIWNLEQRQLLIDTILNGYDIPKIYLHELTQPPRSPLDKQASYTIIDGRQRLETLWAFIDAKFSLDDDFVYLSDQTVVAAKLNYLELGKEYPRLKESFDNFILPIVCVQTDDIYLIDEMLLRLNEAESQGDIQRRNTIGGPMVKIIDEIAKHSFFRNNILFASNRIQLMAVITKLLFLEHSLAKYNKIIDTSKPYIDNFIKAYFKLADLNAKTHGSRVSEILDEMSKIFAKHDTLLPDPTIIIVYYLLFRSAIIQGKINSITRQKLFAFKRLVEDNWDVAQVDINRADFDLTQFEKLTHLGANNASAIKERIKILTDYFEIDNLY